MAWDDGRARAGLREVFDAAVAAADPRVVLARHLPDKPAGRCVVVGGGKSAAVMAAALEDAWPDVALSGVVVTRYGHAVPTRRIDVIEASHPVPDANSERGAREAAGGACRVSAPTIWCMALMSGGASALMALPAAGLTLADKQAVNRALLACGATHFGDERGAQTSLRHQGRPPRRRRRAGARRHAGDQRCAGRRSCGDW